jgi:hypothetical protein
LAKPAFLADDTCERLLIDSPEPHAMSIQGSLG